MDIYNDYASFRLDNDELVKELILKKSDVVSNFKVVYDVVENIYNRKVENQEVTAEEEEIFAYGFDYLFDQFESINNLKDEFYHNYQEMNKHSKTVVFFLYLNEFIKEAKKDNINKYRDLESKGYEYIEKGEELPDELYGALNDLNYKNFDDDYRSVASVFYEIGMEMDVIDDNDDTLDIEKLL